MLLDVNEFIFITGPIVNLRVAEKMNKHRVWEGQKYSQNVADDAHAPHIWKVQN